MKKESTLATLERQYTRLYRYFTRIGIEGCMDVYCLQAWSTEVNNLLITCNKVLPEDSGDRKRLSQLQKDANNLLQRINTRICQLQGDIH